MKKAMVVLVAALFLVGFAWAGGVNRIGGLGPKASGMSGAFTAVADDASAFYYNPAGLTQIKFNYVFVGGDLVLPRFEYEAPLSPALRSENDEMHLMPLFGFSAPVNDKFTFGLGVISPYGLGAKYHQMESLLTLIDLVPAVCWQVTDELSLGAALNLGWSQFAYDAPIMAGGIPVGFSESDASGSGVSATFGTLVKPLDWLGLGIVYRLPTKVKLEGDTKIISPATGAIADDFVTHFTFPGRLTVGAAVKPLTNWTVAFDANWYDYSGADKFRISYDNLPTAFQKLDWRDNCSFHLGTEFCPLDWLALRAGIGYQTAAIPDATISPLTPDASGWDASFGLGVNYKALSIDANYIYAWASRNVSIRPSHVAPGNYEAQVHVVGIVGSLKF